jgi:hypothetical protein
MVLSKLDQFYRLFGLVTIPCAIVAFVLLFVADLSNLMIGVVYSVAVAPIVKTLILHWPWIRIIKANKNGIDYAIWGLALLFAIVQMPFRPDWASEYGSFGVVMQIPSFAVSFCIGLWANHGCRRFMQVNEGGLAFLTTVGRHALINSIVAIAYLSLRYDWVFDLFQQIV